MSRAVKVTRGNVVRGKVARGNVAARYCRRGSVAEPIRVTNDFGFNILLEGFSEILILKFVYK